MMSLKAWLILLFATVAVPAFSGDDGQPSPEQLERKCRPLAAKRKRYQGTMLSGMRTGWTEASERNRKGSVLSTVDQVGATPALERGSVLKGASEDGRPVVVAICAAVPAPDDPRMVWYELQVWNLLAQEWENPCVPTGEVPEPRALALAGTWDGSGARRDASGKLTLACETGTLAKCALWGYRPWASPALASAHQACTRMARADYCGNGEHHTREATVIDYYDSLGVSVRTTEVSPGWDPAEAAFEAAWGPDGATCIARTRYDRPLQQILDECPGRFKPGTRDLGEGDRCALERADGRDPAGLMRNRSIPRKP